MLEAPIFFYRSLNITYSYRQCLVLSVMVGLVAESHGNAIRWGEYRICSVPLPIPVTKFASSDSCKAVTKFASEKRPVLDQQKKT